jgi:predicted nuclease of predicted toxin-antitoxin system
MLFYLDEDLSQRVAAVARNGGVDATSSHECGRDGLPDSEQLRLAAAEGRCVVTRNRDDFTVLTVQCFERQSPHAGVLIVARRLAHAGAEGLAQALIAYAHDHQDGLPPYTIDYLHPALPSA